MTTILGLNTITFGDATTQSTAYDPKTIKKIARGHHSFYAVTSQLAKKNLINHQVYHSDGWTNVFPANTTITTGITDPNGNSNAVRVTCSTSGQTLIRLVNFHPFTPNGTDTYNISFYVKLVSGTLAATTCDLADDGATLHNYTAELSTGNWVKVSYVCTPSATSKTFFDILTTTSNCVFDLWNAIISPLGTEQSKINRVYAWGYNAQNQIPDGTASSSLPIEVVFPPAERNSIVSDMCVMWGAAYVLFTNGNLYVWGYNAYGNLGLGDTNNRTMPVLSATGVSQLYYPDNHHDCCHTSAPEIYIYLKKTDGTFWCCGYNGHGDLANGTVTNSSTWIALTPPTGKTISKLWIGARTGGSSFCKTTDNLIYAVGYNTQGQLGIGNVTQQNSWVQVTYFNAITDVIDIQTGNYYFDGTNSGEYMWTAVLTASGNIYTCGNNTYGQLGDGTVTQRSTFAQVSLTKPVKKMVRGSTCIYVIFTDNTYARWGENTYGQLGNGTATNSPTPIYSNGVKASGQIDNIFVMSRTGYYAHHTGVIISESNGTYISVCGYNSNYSLGTNSTSGNIVTPESIFLDAYSSTGTRLVDALFAGGSGGVACLLQFKDGPYVYLAGYNGNVELGYYPNMGDKPLFKQLTLG